MTAENFTNVYKFKSDIKEWVAAYKEGKDSHWMHPIYCAYYILKHQISDSSKREEIIQNDINHSYKALRNDLDKRYFRRAVNEYLSEYSEETVCTDKQ